MDLFGKKHKMSLKELYSLPMGWEKRVRGRTFVGIDFGTSTTVVSMAEVNPETGNLDCITLRLRQTDEHGNPIDAELLPSVVAWPGSGQVVIGQEAYACKFRPEEFVEHKNLWHSFKMELGQDLGPEWNTETDYDEITSPYDATKAFFRYLNMVIPEAVEKAGMPDDIVYAISVPASFSSNQRNDLLRAATEGGIRISQTTLIDEPNAAFLAYINPVEKGRSPRLPIEFAKSWQPKVLVFDFGAGTCDISLVELYADFEGVHTGNMSISKFSRLGGNDIDRYIAAEILLPRIAKASKVDLKEFTDEEKQSVVRSLTGIAEQLKIKACNAYASFLMKDPDALTTMRKENRGVSVYADYCCPTPHGVLAGDDFKLPYDDFERAIKYFLSAENHDLKGRKHVKSDNTIEALLEDAMGKAHVNKSEIDYVLMVGGSSKNPFVQRAIGKFLPKAKMLTPDGMQTLVSNGAAIHSLLYNAFGIQVIRPIVSEKIVVMTCDDTPYTVVEAGTDIPFVKEIDGALVSPDRRLAQLELPICVGTDQRLLYTLTLKKPDGETIGACQPVRLRLEFDFNKVLSITASCEGQKCHVNLENPLSNEFLTAGEKRIYKARKASNMSTMTRADRKPTWQSMMDLVDAYSDNDNKIMAAETYEKAIGMHPQRICADIYNRIGVHYHNAGNYGKAMEMFKKALRLNADYFWAVANLGHDYLITGEYDKAQQLLEHAEKIKPDEGPLHVKMYRLYKYMGKTELAAKHGEQGYNILMQKLLDRTIDSCDYGWLLSHARDLGKDTEKITKLSPENKKKDPEVTYNRDNLADLTFEARLRMQD